MINFTYFFWIQFTSYHVLKIEYISQILSYFYTFFILSATLILCICQKLYQWRGVKQHHYLALNLPSVNYRGQGRSMTMSETKVYRGKNEKYSVSFFVWWLKQQHSASLFIAWLIVLLLLLLAPIAKRQTSSAKENLSSVKTTHPTAIIFASSSPILLQSIVTCFHLGQISSLDRMLLVSFNVKINKHFFLKSPETVLNIACKNCSFGRNPWFRKRV